VTTSPAGPELENAPKLIVTVIQLVIALAYLQTLTLGPGSRPRPFVRQRSGASTEAGVKSGSRSLIVFFASNERCAGLFAA
jgi:hypothetical protein